MCSLLPEAPRGRLWAEAIVATHYKLPLLNRWSLRPIPDQSTFHVAFLGLICTADGKKHCFTTRGGANKRYQHELAD